MPEERDLPPIRPFTAGAQNAAELVVGPGGGGREPENEAESGDAYRVEVTNSAKSGAEGRLVAGLVHSSATEGQARRPEVGKNLAPGSMFDDKYEILEVLGEGGMSVVYKARHALMNNIVAIKLLKGRYASDSKTVLRFQREGQAVSRLNHPNIVRVYDFGISREGQPFLAIEYLHGMALSDVIQDQGVLPLKKALAMYGQITDALTSAHGAGVVHRDLKPSNIIVLDPQAPFPTVKIVDFGIAKVFDEEEAGQNKLTQTGDIFGSPLYMSPEQCLGHKMDDRSDIYSMGCLMYEGLTGQPPLSGENIFQTFKKQVEETPRTFREVDPKIKDLALIEPVVFKCLAKDPGDRYQTMAQLSRALKDIEGGGTAGSALAGNIKTMAMVRRERIKSISLRQVFTLALLVVLLAGVLGVFFAKSNQLEITLASPEAQACFEMDKGQYKMAQTQFDNMLTEARRNNLHESVVRFLGCQAVLQHILGNKEAEKKDDQERAQITAAGGDRSAVEESNLQLIDTLLSSGQTSQSLEKALTRPVDKMVSIAQNLAWSQEYGSAVAIMDSMISKVSSRLGPNSALLAKLKAQCASMLVQQIVNPVAPFAPGERKAIINKALDLLQVPLELASGDELVLARCNQALAQALNGDTAGAAKVWGELMELRSGTKIGPANRAAIELRLGDIAMVLHHYKDAIGLYESAYRTFLAAKDYGLAAYSIDGFSRSCWFGGALRQRYEFVSTELQKEAVAAPDAVAVQAQLQASLAYLQIWMGTSTATDFRSFFGDVAFARKSQADYLLLGERLALASFVTMQNSRPSDLWLVGTPLDDIIKLYFNSSRIYRAVPLLRLKLAIAERANNDQAQDEASNSLANALLAYDSQPQTKLLAMYDRAQLSASNVEPLSEARALYEKSAKRVTAGGANAIFWLDEWFPYLAEAFAQGDSDKDKLLTACSRSCENVARLYGKNSLEYMLQRRWHGRLAWHLGNRQLARQSLNEARDVAFANDNLSRLEKLSVYQDLIMVCHDTGDRVAADKYTAEMNSLPHD